ncbi:MAG: proline racemase family protein [Tyzzerella sp.]|nr:proline racemase family protein [Tyzzerella sp.]
MNLTPEFHNKYEEFRVLEAHTDGEPARIILSGIPDIEGATMMEKKQFFMENCDYIRTSLCFEPRGHKDMLCVALVEPVHEEADFGVLFLESGGVVNMCGHGAIAAAVAVTEAGLVEMQEPVTHVIFDAPAGMVSIKVNVKNGKAISADLENVPTFAYREGLSIEIEGYGSIMYDIEFSGSFCALVDAEQFSIELNGKNAPVYTEIGMKIMRTLNQEVEVSHPELDIHTIDVIDFYQKQSDGKIVNMAVFGEGQVDRSPCGTGTNAMAAKKYAAGEIAQGDTFEYYSILGCKFTCRIDRTTKVGSFDAIVPIITGGAYIDGYNCWFIDPDDPFKDGFILGM